MYGFARLLTVTRVISIHSPRSDPIRVNSRQSAKTLGNCIQIYARRWRVFIYAYRVNISKAKRIWKWEDTSPLRSNRKEPREPLTVSSQNSGKKNPKEPCSHMHRWGKKIGRFFTSVVRRTTFYWPSWRNAWRRGWPSSCWNPAPGRTARWNRASTRPGRSRRRPASSPMMECLISRPAKKKNYACYSNVTLARVRLGLATDRGP